MSELVIGPGAVVKVMRNETHPCFNGRFGSVRDRKNGAWVVAVMVSRKGTTHDVVATDVEYVPPTTR